MVSVNLSEMMQMKHRFFDQSQVSLSSHLRVYCLLIITAAAPNFSRSCEFFSFSLTFGPQLQLSLVYMEIFRFDRQRSNCHKVVLGEFISHQRSQTSHKLLFVLTHWVSGDIWVFFSSSGGKKQLVFLCCILIAAFFGTSDAIAEH